MEQVFTSSDSIALAQLGTLSRIEDLLTRLLEITKDGIDPADVETTNPFGDVLPTSPEPSAETREYLLQLEEGVIH